MKGLMSALFLTLLATTTANAQAIDGDWQGTLTAGPVKLRLVLHLTPDGKGGLAATLDSPDQGVKGIGVSSAAFCCVGSPPGIVGAHARVPRACASEGRGLETGAGPPPLPIRSEAPRED
jgi:hypothetical protein